MVLGDHGRKILAPMTMSQKFAHFPWAKMYHNSMYFRAMCGVGLVFAAGWSYILVRGIDLSFTPYSAVHHSIGHKFAHDMEHIRYPAEHHHDAKKH